MLRVAAAAVLLGLAAGASPQELPVPASARAVRSAPRAHGGAPAPNLGLSLELLLEPAGGARDGVVVDAPARDPGAPRACPVDWCQPRVDVPGLDTARGRIGRTELVATLLDDADLATLASLVWLLARTGLEVDWRPPRLDTSSGASSGGLGSVTLWLKLRMDPWNRPSFPERARDRIRRERALEEQREVAAERERAREAERARERADQRPARLSST